MTIPLHDNTLQARVPSHARAPLLRMIVTSVVGNPEVKQLP